LDALIKGGAAERFDVFSGIILRREWGDEADNMAVAVFACPGF
jgi:hypothetical protein